MNQLPPSESAYNVGRQAHDEGLQDDGDLLNTVLSMPVSKHRIVTRTPEEPFRLNFVDVTCLVVNRTIGTGIFSGPQEVMRGVRSPGIAILIWFLGCIYSLSGAHVFIEYGLNVPRYVINGVEQSVPRSGGELHYLQYVFSWPRFRQGTVLLSCVLFGISFICVGNMASNCIDCALRILQSRSPDKSDEEFRKGVVYGIAIIIATVTCFIHAFSRRGGILLSNGLAAIKVCFMLAIIIATWAKAGGPSGIYGLQQANEDNAMVPTTSYNEHAGYTQAFTTVVFAFFGFYQPNYVLSEIKNPRKTLPKSIWWGMGIVCVLYIAVNICYMIVVPVGAQIDNNVAQEFFKRVFNDNYRAKQTVNAFMAISSFGNIVVWTFTAVRMKQEIAKQCFIPFAGFFAKDKDVSLGRLLEWFDNGSRSARRRSIRFLNPANHREKTPVGALILHLATCIILLMATYTLSPNNAYLFLSRLLSYVLAACFGTLLAIGILILHFRGPPATQPIQTPNHHHNPEQQPVQKTWSEMTRDTINPRVGIACAVIYLVTNFYLVISTWVPPARSAVANVSKTGAWYVVPVVSWCILAFSGLWFLGFVIIITYRSRSGRKTFIYMREPEFEWAQRSKDNLGGDESGDLGYSTSTSYRGGLILAHETVYRTWEATETPELSHHGKARVGTSDFTPHAANGETEQEHGHGLAGTDFDNFSDPASPRREETVMREAGQAGHRGPRGWEY